MPEAIRTDNGAPFASHAIAGLSRLAVWWIKLGIRPERIAAGHPEQNGRHERMHRTLKQETAQPPAANRRKQQQALDRFREENNRVRPHEALQMQTPAAVYQPSPRTFPAQVPEPEYPETMLVRSVRRKGHFRWNKHDVFLSEVLWSETSGVAAGGWKMVHDLLRAVPHRAIRLPGTASEAIAQNRPGRKNYSRGGGRGPLLDKPSPAQRGTKTVRDVPGLNCQGSANPYTVQYKVGLAAIQFAVHAPCSTLFVRAAHL